MANEPDWTDDAMRFPLVLAVFLTSLVATAQESPHLIAPGQAGNVRIGDYASSVYRLYPREQRRLFDLELEGSLTPALALTLSGSETEGGIVAELWIRNNALVVYRIQVRDPVMKTAEGIGVGSTMAELRSAYQEVDDIASFGEPGIYVVVESLGFSFELDLSAISSMRAGDPVPDETTIIGVLINNPR